MGRSVLVLDFDRVVNDTDAFLDAAIKTCETVGICSQTQYRYFYKQWSDQARNLQAGEMRVSLLTDFVPTLAEGVTKDHPRDRNRFTDSIRSIHERQLTINHRYQGAERLLTAVPRDNLFIFTAGNVLEQREKINASGLFHWVEPNHVAIILAKTREVFAETLLQWGIDEADTVIHVNDRPGELVELHDVHPKTISVMAAWCYKDTIPQVPEGIHVAQTIDSCVSLIGRAAHHPEIQSSGPSRESRA